MYVIQHYNKLCIIPNAFGFLQRQYCGLRYNETELDLHHFQETFHFSQLEKLLDIDSEFVALLKLEVRPYNNKDTIEEYRMVLYRLGIILYTWQ